MTQLPFILIRLIVFYKTQRYFIVYNVGQIDDDIGGYVARIGGLRDKYVSLKP